MDQVNGMLRRYDLNKNGVLERNEWRDVQWRTDPNGSDLNKDGRLTKKELAVRIGGFRDDDAKRRSERFRGGSSSRSSTPAPSGSFGFD